MADYNPELVSVVKDLLTDILDPDGTLEYYLDYREEGCLNSAEDLKTLVKYLDEANGNIKQAASYALYDIGDTWILDIEDEYEREVIGQLEEGLESYDAEHGTNLYDEFQDLDIYEFIRDCGYNGVNFNPLDFFPSQLCMELTLATYEEANHEGYILDFFGGYYPHESNLDDPEMRDNMLVEFLQSQGYTPEDVVDETKSGKVLDSVRAEINNISSHIDFLTVCASFDLEEAARLLSGDFSSITIEPGSTMGIFDSWSGGGSLFEIDIASAWTVPADKVERVKLSNSKDWGYPVAEVYGINANDTDFYRDTVRVN